MFCNYSNSGEFEQSVVPLLVKVCSWLKELVVVNPLTTLCQTLGSGLSCFAGAGACGRSRFSVPRLLPYFSGWLDRMPPRSLVLGFDHHYHTPERQCGLIRIALVHTRQVKFTESSFAPSVQKVCVETAKPVGTDCATLFGYLCLLTLFRTLQSRQLS